MAKLYFYYSTMNAGKSTSLLQAAHNYAERGMRTLLFTAKLDEAAAAARSPRASASIPDALLFDAAHRFLGALLALQSPLHSRRRGPVPLLGPGQAVVPHRR